MRWVTYFPEINNVHLVKDVGMIPLYASHSGYRSQLLGHFTDTEYPNLEGEASGLEIMKLTNREKWFFLDKAFLDWLRTHAMDVDVLHLFHLSRDTLFYGAYYKGLNPKGKLYLKLDAYNDHLRSRKAYAKGFFKKFFLKQVEKRFFKGLDVVSVENTLGFELALETYPEWKDKLIYLPNGCNDLYLNQLSLTQNSGEKIILSVGRPGSPDKNYELLLEALPYLHLGEYQMVIIGPVSNEFSQRVEQLFFSYPHLKEKVIFTGPISDRKRLYHYFQKASVFFLPSRTESFGIAFVEALYFGCILVGHEKMAAYNDLSNNGEFGVYFEDNNSSSFRKALQKAILKSSESGIDDRAHNHASENFYWSQLMARLVKKLHHE